MVVVLLAAVRWREGRGRHLISWRFLRKLMQLRAKLSVQLDLTEPQVDNWFRYRRSKDERWSCYRRSKDKKKGSEKIGYNPWRKRNTNNCTPKKKLKSSDSEDASDSDAPMKKKQCGLVDNVSPMPDSSSDSEDASDSDDSSDSDGGDVPFKKKQCGLVDKVSPMPISVCIPLPLNYVMHSMIDVRKRILGPNGQNLVNLPFFVESFG
ncbi:putative transcription factor homeobox-WOX family [Helianthus anomalus]